MRAGAVLARAGIVRPLSPQKLAAIAGQLRRYGTCPASIVAISAIRWPDRLALIDDAGSVTYAELVLHAQALAHHLAGSYGARPGRGVAVMCRNHRGLVEAIMAAGYLGADVLLVNTELPAAQLALTLSRHQPAVVVHDDEFGERLTSAGATSKRHTIWAGAAPVSAALTGGRLGKVDRVGNLILLTSGTTGAPKGVPRQPHLTALLGVAVSAIERLGMRAGDTMMVCPPAFHGMGLICLMLGLATGSTVVMQRRFDASAVVETIEDRQVTTLVAVPAMLQRLLEVPDLGVRSGSLRAVLSGASQLSPVVATRFMDTVGDVLYDGYGSSEVGIVTLATPSDLRAAPGTLGAPTQGTRIAILDESGRPVTPGEVGEIYIDSPMTFDGYTGGGHKEVRNGYLATGDVGRLDACGRLFIEGRADDMIVSGGENVFPQPVETALLSHPTISDAAVVGVADDDFGQRLRAFIVVKATADFDEGSLLAYLRERLTRYELPRDIVVVDELPRNATGKVLRKQLAATGHPS